MKKIFLALAVVLAAILTTTPAYAIDPICESLVPGSEQYYTAGCDDSSNPADEAMTTVGNVLNSVYFAVGLVAVGMITFGGFRYALSQGDPNNVKRAKNTIIYAIVGLVVVLSAFTITNFILGIM